METIKGAVIPEMGDNCDVNTIQPLQELKAHDHLPTTHPGLHGLSPFSHVYPGVSWFSPFVTSDMFLAGFTDCAEEAIRYLIEVEGLSHDNPLVVGLKRDLNEKQRILQLNYLLQNTFQLNSPHPMATKTYEQNRHPDTCIPEYVYNSAINNGPVTCAVESLPNETALTSQSSIQESTESGKECTMNISEGTGRLVSELVDELFSLLQEDDGSYLESDSDTDEGFDEMSEQEVVT